jgi:hypothetical protein
LELFTHLDQLLALTMQRSSAFLFFAGHAHHRQGIAIALDEAIQL